MNISKESEAEAVKAMKEAIATCVTTSKHIAICWGIFLMTKHHTGRPIYGSGPK
jgi:hypothetical protein